MYMFQPNGYYTNQTKEVMVRMWKVGGYVKWGNHYRKQYTVPQKIKTKTAT